MKQQSTSDLKYLIGYGTLLFRASLGSSIGQSSATNKEFIPVIIDGYIRTFNLRPDHYIPSYKLQNGSDEGAAMNVEPSASHSFSGIAFRTSEEELDALNKREAYYQPHVVPMKAFETGEPLGEGSVYVGLEAWITRDPSKLMPLWRDVVWGRTGAYQMGQRFGEYFDKSTYLADGKTLVVDVYRELLKDISDVEFPM